MIPLDNVFKFTEMLHEFQQVRRRVLVNGEDRYENDWEHSFQTAMMAWYVVSTSNEFDLDMTKILRYALAHDLVEVYAGDTPFNKDREKKEEREHKAKQKLQKEFPEFTDLHEAISAYEDRADQEAQFVYALDKIVPLINIYLDDGRSWKSDGVDLQTLREHKKDKFDDSPRVEKYYEKLMDLFAREENRLFDANS